MKVPNEAQAIERSPADVLRLVVAAVFLVATIVVAALFGDTLVAFFSELLAGLSSVPRWLLHGFAGSVRIGAVIVVVMAIGRGVARGRSAYLARIAAAAGFGICLFAVLRLLAPDPGTATVSGIIAPGFPTALGLTAVVAVLTASAPWTSRSGRRLSWGMVMGLSLVRFVSLPLDLDTGIALLAGWLAGAGALVLLGAPSRRPTASAIAGGLTDVGVELAELVPASVDARGSTPYLGTTVDGRKLFVKALGDDERSADLLFRMWRRATNRKLGDEPSFSTLRRAVEHEALVALTARDLGVPTPRFVALARAEPHGFVLAYEAVDGRSLDRVQADEMTDELLRSVWRQVEQLRLHRIAHRDLRLANLFRVADGSVLLIDFGFAELAASDLLLDTDVAELMASTATVVGPERAVSAARAVMGDERVSRSRSRLELRYLSGATRTALRKDSTVLASLQRLVHDAVLGRASSAPSADGQNDS
ncbi:MAG TPA: lipopolysaccharide kinase InaA family protein [Acidimicrobiales bacterium]